MYFFFLVDQVENTYIECKNGEETGKVHLSQMQIITPLSVQSKQQVYISIIKHYSRHTILPGIHIPIPNIIFAA